MNLDDLEKAIQALPAEQLSQFAHWFDDYRSRLLTSLLMQSELTPEQEETLRSRMASAREHPELMEPWEGTTDRLREELNAYCAQKAAGSGS